MPNNSEIITLILMLISFLGIIDMSYRREKGKIIKELKNIKNPSKLTILYINEYKHFFEFRWWHWLSLAVFGLSLFRIVIDLY
jgi:hypothetical protein